MRANARDSKPRTPARQPALPTASPPRRQLTGGTERLLALQRSIGNAAVSRLIEESRHEHGAGCGHEEASSAPVQRSTVHDVLRSPG